MMSLQASLLGYVGPCVLLASCAHSLVQLRSVQGHPAEQPIQPATLDGPRERECKRIWVSGAYNAS